MVVLQGGITADNDRYAHQCIWQMTVSIGDNSVVISYPLTVEFNIKRDTFASSNTATFNIYNLSPSHRESDYFFQDRFNISQLKIVTFKAGYNGALITIFKGYILESYSKRNGVDVITSMQCMDLGTANQHINTTFDAGTSFKDAISNVIQNSGLQLGNIGDLNGQFQTPTSFEGTPLDVLNQISGGHSFIDNGVVNVLQNNEAISGNVTEIRAENGLISTPERRGGQVEVTSIFNPNFIVGQWINIKSDIASKFTGTYKICGIAHHGTISGAVSGQRTTRLNLLSGAFLPNSNYNLTGKIGQGAQEVRGTAVKPLNGTISNTAQGVYNYIKNHNGRIPSARIIGAITWADMLKQDNEPAHILAQISPAICQNCITIATKLYNYIHARYPRASIRVTSGWRTTQNNAHWGGEATSAHLKGLAIDFYFADRNTFAAYNQTFAKTWDRFTYYNAKHNIIHVQATYGKKGARRQR